MQQPIFSVPRIWLTSLVVLCAMVGCQKDFLDRKPLGDLTYDTFFQNADQAILATNAVYQQYREFDCVALPWIGLTDVISDDADKGSTPTDALYMVELDNFTFNATNTAMTAAWKKPLRGHRPGQPGHPAYTRHPDGRDVEKTGWSVNASLSAPTAIFCWYSGSAICRSSPNLWRATNTTPRARSPKTEVYAQIERDLQDAIATLPEKSQYAAKDLGRATKGAARGILAKLYMIEKDFPKAEQACLDIINSGEYDLLPKYADNFMRIGENGRESIFEINAVATATQDAAGPGASPYNMVQGVRGVPNLGWGFNRPSDNLVSSYENGDPRREATVIYEGEVLPDGVTKVQHNPEIINARYNQKAWVPAHPGLQDNGPGNIRVLRYSDILLLAAEALNENGKSSQALVYLNQVRKRARGTSTLLLPDITITDQGQLREKIYRERRSELAMEQQRWFDLLRWGRAKDVMTAVGKDFVAGKNELLPVPQTEVDLTEGKISQNLGY